MNAIFPIFCLLIGPVLLTWGLCRYAKKHPESCINHTHCRTGEGGNTHR